MSNDQDLLQEDAHANANAAQARGEAQEGTSDAEPDTISTLSQKSPTEPKIGLSEQKSSTEALGYLADEEQQEQKTLNNSEGRYWSDQSPVTDGVAKTLIQDDVRQTEKRLNKTAKTKKRILILILIIALLFYVRYVLRWLGIRIF